MSSQKGGIAMSEYNVMFTMYIIVLLVSICLVVIPQYVLNGIAYMKLAKRRNMPNPWLAWVPFANSYLIGAVADNINGQYQKPTNRRVLLLVLSIISVVTTTISSIFSVNIIFDLLYNIQWIEQGMYTPDLSSFGWMIILMSVLMIIGVTASIWGTVLRFMSYYTVFKEYAPDNSGLFIAVSLVAYLLLSMTFLPGIFILIIQKNTPQFILLNTRSAYHYGPYGQPQQPYQGGQQPPYGNPPYPPQPPYQQQPPQNQNQNNDNNPYQQ